MRFHRLSTLAIALAVLLAATTFPAHAQPGTGPISGGGGGGGLPGANEVTEAMLKIVNAGSDEQCLTKENSVGDFEWQSCGGGEADALAPAVVIEGATADAFEGNFTFADPTADWTVAFNAIGRATFQDVVAADSFYVLGNGSTSELENVRIVSSSTLYFSNGVDYGRGLTGAGVTGPVVKVTSAINLSPLASPPRTCDATAEGDIYSDTSHALCWCDASAWQKLSGAGTCA